MSRHSEGAIATATVKLLLQYDGRDFHGWQLQPGLRTVQGAVEEALGGLYGRPIRVHGAGRTDAGVHARGQVAHARVPIRHAPLTLRRALNATLPRDVWVADVKRGAPRFHARFDAVARTYRYVLGTADHARSPFHRPWCWAHPERLDGEVLRAAAREVVGEHDFGAFARAGAGSRICRVGAAAWDPDPLGWRFTITADRFLRGMVRALVGAFVTVARGSAPPGALAAALSDPTSAPVSTLAPPQGLFLWKVDYVDDRAASETRTVPAA